MVRAVFMGGMAVPSSRKFAPGGRGYSGPPGASLREGDAEADEVPPGGGPPDDALPEPGDGRGVRAERTGRPGEVVPENGARGFVMVW